MSTFDFLGVDEKESEAAAEGTEAHELAAEILEGGEAHPAASPEMVWGVGVYVEEIRRLEAMGFSLLIEHSVEHNRDHRIGGTADAILWNANTRHLVVADFKFGWKRVEAENNAQLMLYAWLYCIQQRISPTTVTLVIVQPRADHPKGPIRRWDADLLDLSEFGSKVEAAVAETGRAPKEVVGDHCLWCKRAPLCKALAASNQIVIDGASEIAKGTAVSPERLAELLAQVPRAQAMLKALWSYAESQLARGVQIPGYALDAENYGRRKWLNWPLAENFLVRKGVDPHEIYTKEPASPAQVEKLLTKEDRRELASFITKDKLSPKMVSSADVKSPVAGVRAADVFKRVEKTQGE